MVMIKASQAWSKSQTLSTGTICYLFDFNISFFSDILYNDSFSQLSHEFASKRFLKDYLYVDRLFFICYSNISFF